MGAIWLVWGAIVAEVYMLTHGSESSEGDWNPCRIYECV